MSVNPVAGKVEYYHGGPAGRKIGEWILPPRLTGVRSTPMTRHDRVYLTPLLRVAYQYAVAWKDPTLYVVEPDGEVEIDPYPGATSTLCYWPVMCARARVVEQHPVPQDVIEEMRDGGRPWRGKGR